MKARFENIDGKRLLVEALLSQRMVAGNRDVAEYLADHVALLELNKDDVLIEQDGDDNDLYFILAGSFRIIINGKLVSVRGANNHVGEMTAIEPSQRRSANVVADEPSTVAKLSESDLAIIAAKHPDIWRGFAAELARRLLERNKLINAPHDKIRLFVISSKEAIPIAKAIEEAFKNETFQTKLWTDDVFRVANYTLEDLEREVDLSDFAVAIAHPDDHTNSRGKKWPAPRDNVVFELGLFMGRLGRSRAILMEPRDEGVKLPSDLAGIKTITYQPLPKRWRRTGSLFSRILGSAPRAGELENALAGACKSILQFQIGRAHV